MPGTEADGAGVGEGLRVLHCPTDVGGNAWGVSRGERALGCQSDVMYLSESGFGYPADVVLGARRAPTPGDLRLRRRFVRDARERYNVFHFNFGRTIVDYPRFGLDYWDIGTLEAAGGSLFVSYLGCDIRRRSLRGDPSTHACAVCDVRSCGMLSDRAKRRRAAILRKHVRAAFVVNPDLLRFAPWASFLPYGGVDIHEWIPRQTEPEELVVAHAPSSRAIKGTRYLIAAVDELRKSRFPRLRLDLIESVPHGQMRARLSAASVFVDQLLVGWYGRASVEAAALGVPVVCYIHPADRSRVDFGDRIPFVSATPAELQDVLEILLADAEGRRSLAARCRSFVEDVHDPVKIAQTLIRIYKGGDPCAA